MKKVLFIWEVKKDLQAYLIEHLNTDQLQLIFPEKKEEAILLEHAPTADAIVGWRPSNQLLKKAEKLQLYINPGAGVQHLLEHKALLEKCVVVNGHGNAFFTAEHIVAMLLNITNRIQAHHQWMLEGKWRLGDKEAKSISLQKLKVGLFGYGHVGQKVHTLLTPFGCEFHILKRTPEKGQYGPQDLEAFLTQIDVLITALPHTSATENRIGSHELSLLGKNGIVIHAGRGKIIQEEAFYDALKAKTIQSAAIDVWYNYDVEADESGRKFPSQFPFYELDNVLLSPHRAASPFGDLERWDDVVENLNQLANEQTTFLNVVDLEREY